MDEVISYKDFDLTFTNQRNINGITDSKYIVLDVTIVSKKDNFTFFGDIQGVTDDNEVVDDKMCIRDRSWLCSAESETLSPVE